MKRIRYLVLSVVTVVCCSAWGQATLAERVCWIDNDLSTLTSIGSSVATVDVTSLAAGPHTLTMQVKDSEGRWSVPVTKIFVKPHATQKATAIVERQYWIDNDPTGRDALGESVATVDVASLPLGMHSLTMRVRDDGGMWSVPVTKFFVVTRAKVKATEIVVRKFWIDNDAATRTDLAPSVAAVDISALAVGMHSLTMHVQDNAGVWSLPVTKFFVKSAEALEAVSIKRCMYWFDGDAENFRLTEPAGASGVVDVDVSGLAAGEHTIYWRVGDSKGAWSQKVFSSLFRYAVPASGIGTFSAAQNMLLPPGLAAHLCTYFKPHQSLIHVDELEGSVVPAETGVLMTGEADKAYTLLPTEESAPAVESNALVAVMESRHVAQTEGEYTNFMLKSGRFIKIADAAETSKMPANRAYLQVLSSLISAQTAANGITLVWGDQPTGIDATETGNSKSVNSGYHDLQGRYLGTQRPTQKGIYIVNGRKVVIGQ